MGFFLMEEKLIVIEKEMGCLSSCLIRRKFKVTLEMAMKIKIKEKFYEEREMAEA